LYERNREYPKSVQNASPYNTYQSEVRKENKLEKLTRITTQDFVVRKADPLRHGEALRATDVYTKPNHNITRKVEHEKHVGAEFVHSTSKITKPFDTVTIPYITSQAPALVRNRGTS
jgi:hypothetical protein